MAAVLPFPREPSSHAPTLTIVESTAEQSVPIRRSVHHTLLLEPTLMLSHENMRIFRAVNYMIHTTHSWVQMLDDSSQSALDSIILNIDAIDAAVSSNNISAKRLITLLRKITRLEPLTIIAVSARDYVEVEDILQCGVNVFAPQSLSTFALVQRIEAARQRQMHLIQVS